jgi:flagellar biosynthesis GTPase FlhF
MDNDENRITVFAKTNFRNKEVPFGIKTDDRRRHMYLIGKTGMGKTTLMENMVIQDIQNGHGVAFLDPHGDSVQRILDCVPSSRINDVIYFNPADMEYPVAFNILESVDPKYKHLVASGLMGVFTKIWANLWSARMEYILNNTILALLDSPGNTLLGITRMYVDKKYRKKIVDNIKDPMVRAFWVDEFANYNEKYRTEAIAPIQNKVGQFLSSGIIRNIVGQPKSTIDLRDIMDNRKILIMDLSKGKVGEDNSALLGAMLVTKIQLAAMSRTDIDEKDRKDFYLYVDEFQNFATESFATILSEARKYRLNLIVGHQYIAQLEEDRSTKVRDAIFGNVGTIIIFRIGAVDAEFLETEFEPIFTPGDLVNLPKYSIILKLMINGVASDPFSAITLAPNPAYLTGNSEKVLKVSRERYANPASEVEEKISRWMGAEYHQESALLIGAEEQQSAAPPEQNQRPAKAEVQESRETKEFTEHTNPEPVQKPFVEKRNQDLGSPGKTHQQKDRSHGQQRQQPRPQNKGNNNRGFEQRPQQKKENPIWDKVASIHQEKINQSNKKTSDAVTQILTQSSRPAIPSPQTEPVAVQKKILNPGESHQL